VEVLLYDSRPPIAMLQEGMTWVQGDIEEYDTIEKTLTDFGQVSAVFHLLPLTLLYADPHGYVNQPLSTKEESVTKVSRVLFCSNACWARGFLLSVPQLIAGEWVRSL
jgi:hypothetical protein